MLCWMNIDINVLWCYIQTTSVREKTKYEEGMNMVTYT